MSSGSPRRPRLRALVVLVVLVGSSCAAVGSRPVLGDSGSAEQVADAMRTLARVEGDIAVPTPHPPELFGFETVTPAEEVVPDVLWFDLAVPVRELGGDESDLAADVLDPDAVSDSEDVVDPDEVSEDPEVELPDPPESVQAEGAPYPDPSAIVVAASGRHFPLFADDAPGATTRGVSPDVITIGGLVTQTLVGNPYRGAVCAGARARFDQANHNGELTRRIEFVACHDDTGQSDLARGLVGALVREEVFAIVPLASPAFLAEELLYEERVLYVGDEVLPGFCGRSTSLGFGSHGARGCPVLDARGYVSIVEPVLTAYLAMNAEMEGAAITYATTKSPDGEIAAASRTFEAELLERVEPTMLGVLPTAADGDPTRWSAVVAEILETEPEVVFLDGPRVKGLPAAIRSAGFDGELVLVGAVDPLTVIDTESRLGLAPLTVITPGLDLANRASPGWQAMEGAAAAVGIQADEIGLDFVEGYLAADFMVQALAATPEPLTVERVADGLNKGWWYGGIDGVACGSWWPASHFISTPCVSISRIEVFVDQLIPELALVDVEPQLKFNLSRD